MNKLKPQNAKKSNVVMTELIHPSHTNALNSVFGGVVISWVDIAGAISAGRYSNRSVVTANMDDVHFIAPAYQGDIINIKACVNYVHKTSMEVGVRVDSENPVKKTTCRIMSAYLTFVALDENRNPVPVPPLKISTPDEKKRFESARLRRKWRLNRRKQFLSS